MILHEGIIVFVMLSYTYATLTSFQDKWYNVTRVTTRNIDEAYTICRSIDMELLSIHSRGEQEFLHTLIRENTLTENVWLSFRLNQYGIYQWEDGSSSTFENWKRYKPYNEDHTPAPCTEYLRNSGRWNDISCKNVGKQIEVVCMVNNASKCTAFEINCNGECIDECEMMRRKAIECLYGNGKDRCGAFSYNRSKNFPCRYSNETFDSVLATCAKGCNKSWSGFDCQMPRLTSKLSGINNRIHGSFERFGNYCYYANHVNWTSFSEATRMCSLIDMELLSVHSDEEKRFVLNLTKESNGKLRSVWMALRRNSKGQFTWENGMPLTYTMWDTDEPNNLEKEHCVEFFLDDGTWNNYVCNTNRNERIGYVCKNKGDCSQLPLKCENGACINANKRCENHSECVQCTNEGKCDMKCTQLEFECIKECIDQSAFWRCNVNNDCLNNTDEIYCSLSGPLPIYCSSVSKDSEITREISTSDLLPISTSSWSNDSAVLNTKGNIMFIFIHILVK